MSNQRAGKTHAASGADNGNLMSLKNFFKEAANQLDSEGHADAAFYFEQIEEWIVMHGSIPKDPSTISKALGL